MTIAYFDCFAGAAGDMIVGALIDAGADFAALQSGLGKLKTDGCSLRAKKVQRAGLDGTKFYVDLADQSAQPPRGFSDIRQMIRHAGLPDRAAQRARRIFRRQAQVEAKVHGINIERVHFHELGAVDSIMDIVACCLALELLGVERVFCSPIPVGSGTFRCQHGVLPAPAPAAAELLIGAKVLQNELAGEITTPTGAAVLTTLSEGFGAMPAMTVTAVGYGAGTRDTPDAPNLLRVFIGELDESGQADTVVELSANIDDCTGELLGATIEKLLQAGCLDAWATPIFMKKSRPAWMISALCAEADTDRAEQIIFAETTTFGIRRRRMARSKLLREFATVETPYGPIRIKVGRRGAQEVTCSPEFADCQAAAEAHHVAVKEVLAAAEAAYREGKEK